MARHSRVWSPTVVLEIERPVRLSNYFQSPLTRLDGTQDN